VSVLQAESDIPGNEKERLYCISRREGGGFASFCKG